MAAKNRRRLTGDRDWVRRNLGFDPVDSPPPATTVAFTRAAPTPTEQDRQRELIDFDSEGPAGSAFLAYSTATGLSRFTDIPWPKALAPKPDRAARKGKDGALPRADVLVVTWTVDEGHALSRVLTPGKDSRNDYVAYRHNFAEIARKMTRGCPAVEAGRLGAYWTTSIGAKRVVVFKSDSHLSQDTKVAPGTGQTLPNEDLWKQIISEVNPELVITTGTAGGIGPQCEVGDVVVSPLVRFDCQKWLKNEPFKAGEYRSVYPNARYLPVAKKLFKANAGQLPKDNTRAPRITVARSFSKSVVTTDFFGFDTSDNRYHLKGEGSVSEMGDAVLGLEQSRADAKKVNWVAVRNVSDPQIRAVGTPSQQANIAAQIYKGFGRWSTVCSAIVCWALIAA